MNIAIIGAAGRTGRCLTGLALLQGHHVTAAARDTSAIGFSHERLRSVACDVRDAASVRAALHGQEVVLCALGGPRRHVTVYSEGAHNIVRAMEAQHVRRLVFLSNYGVLGEQARGLLTNTMLRLGKLVLKDTLADHRRALDILRASCKEWVAVRPMALTDTAGTRRYRVDAHGLPANGTHIARADVAHFMLHAAVCEEFLGKVPAVAY